jgi:hypothetical protein
VFPTFFIVDFQEVTIACFEVVQLRSMIGLVEIFDDT